MQQTPIIKKKSPHHTEERDPLFHFLSPIFKMSEISPNRAPFPETVSGPVPDKSAKPSVSVRVETGTQ
jgi:hypothetical protein